MKKYNIKTKYGQLCFYLSTTSSDAKASIGIIHGLGEHIGRYEHVFKFFNKEGFNCFGFDSYGHGLSSGKRGDAISYQQWIEEIKLINEHFISQFPKPPLVLYGHSLGGNKLLHFLLKSNSLPKLAIVTSPFIQEGVTTPRVKIEIAKLLVRIMPTIALSNGLPKNALSRDNKVHKRYYSDPLVHHQITLRAGKEALKAAKELQNYISGMPIPVLLMHGTNDICTSYAHSEKFANQNTNIHWVSWKDAMHELHNEINKTEILTAIVNWLNSEI